MTYDGLNLLIKILKQLSDIRFEANRYDKQVKEEVTGVLEGIGGIEICDLIMGVREKANLRDVP